MTVHTRAIRPGKTNAFPNLLKNAVHCFLIIICFLFYTSSILHADENSKRLPDTPGKNVIETRIKILQTQIHERSNLLLSVEDIETAVKKILSESKIRKHNRHDWEEVANSAKDLMKKNYDAEEYNQFWDSFADAVSPVFYEIQNPILKVWRQYRGAERNTIERKLFRKVFEEYRNHISTVVKKNYEENTEWKDFIRTNFSLKKIQYTSIKQSYNHYNNRLKSAIKFLSKSSGEKVDNITSSILDSLIRINSDIFQREKEKIQNRIGEFERKIANLGLNLRELKEDESRLKSEINNDLILAIYLMIGALVILFLGLRIFSNQVAVQLINRRSLVEVIGMAFMLITIIILGTGGRLSEEILGTLLGTIAGYIFARSVQRRNGSGPPLDNSGKEPT